MGAVIAQIREKIDRQGLTVYSLEKRAGLKPNAVHNILSGRSKNPSINVIQAIAKTLNCTVSDLLGEDFISAAHSSSLKNMPVNNTSHLTIDNYELYTQCLSYFSSLLAKKKFWLPKDKLLHCIDEVYFYSARKGSKKPDFHFAHWLLEGIQGQPGSAPNAPPDPKQTYV